MDNARGDHPAERQLALDALLRGHSTDCACQPCADLRKGLADIASAERDAWELGRDVYIR